MDSGTTVPEEHLSESECIGDGDVFQIRELDLRADICKFLPTFWEAWRVIHNEEKNGMTSVKINGVVHEVPEIEALVYWYLYDESSKIRVHIKGDEVCAFVIYNPVFEGVVAIRMLYVAPECNKLGFGQNLVDSIPGVHHLLFQTKRDVIPLDMLKATGTRPKTIYKDALTMTHSMNWEKNNGK